MPYQSLSKCGQFLVAATTSHIDTFSFSDGTRLSRWSCPKALDAAPPSSIPDPMLTTQNSENSSIDIVLDSQPTAKKRRLSLPSGESPEVISKKQRKTARPGLMNSGCKNPEAPNLIALTSTKDSQHVIAVTGEDKTVRVFQQNGKGVIEQLSERTMLKRPCAITLSQDDSTIIIADKFGDVYSIPLVFEERQSSALESKASTSETLSQPKAFVAAANNLTIHTQRNRKALENQLKMMTANAEKAELKFEHQLLVGHVSMLTDVALKYHNGRSYIVTADRDEHIRISRGIPQSHIIERFCLGHTEFVSRLCFPDASPEILISGGGDGLICTWRWESGELLGTADLRDWIPSTTRDQLANGDGQDLDPVRITVSGIYDLGAYKDETLIAVICEGHPTIFVLTCRSDGTATLSQVVQLSGNALAIASKPDCNHVVVSIDTLHRAGSTTEVRELPQQLPAASLVSFMMKDGQMVGDGFVFGAELGEKEEGVVRPGLSGLLYSLSSLRKRGGEE